MCDLDIVNTMKKMKIYTITLSATHKFSIYIQIDFYIWLYVIQYLTLYMYKKFKVHIKMKCKLHIPNNQAIYHRCNDGKKIYIIL